MKNIDNVSASSDPDYAEMHRGIDQRAAESVRKILLVALGAVFGIVAAGAVGVMILGNNQ